MEEVFPFYMIPRGAPLPGEVINSMDDGETFLVRMTGPTTLHANGEPRKHATDEIVAISYVDPPEDYSDREDLWDLLIPCILFVVMVTVLAVAVMGVMSW